MTDNEDAYGALGNLLPDQEGVDDEHKIYTLVCIHCLKDTPSRATQER